MAGRCLADVGLCTQSGPTHCGHLKVQAYTQLLWTSRKWWSPPPSVRSGWARKLFSWYHEQPDPTMIHRFRRKDENPGSLLWRWCIAGVRKYVRAAGIFAHRALGRGFPKTIYFLKIICFSFSQHSSVWTHCAPTTSKYPLLLFLLHSLTLFIASEENIKSSHCAYSTAEVPNALQIRPLIFIILQILTSVYRTISAVWVASPTVFYPPPFFFCWKSVNFSTHQRLQKGGGHC